MFDADPNDLVPSPREKRIRRVTIFRYDLQTNDLDELLQMMWRRVWQSCTARIADPIAPWDYINPMVTVKASSRNRHFHSVIEDEMALCQDRLADEFGLEPDDLDLNLNTKVFPEQMSIPDRQERIDLLWTGVLRKNGVIQPTDSWLNECGLVKFG